MSVASFITETKSILKTIAYSHQEHLKKLNAIREAKRAAEEAERKAQEYADQLQRQKEYSVAQFDNDIVGRYEELSMLDTPGGRIAIIHKQYDYYISEWIYSLSEDGKLTRHRDQDGASVSFNSIAELLSDFDRYRYSGFNLYVPPHSSSSSL